MLGDTPVKVRSQQVTYREKLTTLVATKVGTPWYVAGLPRQTLWVNQTDAGAAASLVVEWAIRDSATAGVPEWLTLQTIVLVPGGSTPVVTQLVNGAVWLRFTLSGGPGGGSVAEIAASAFV